jgi:hypothetical protein
MVSSVSDDEKKFNKTDIRTVSPAAKTGQFFNATVKSPAFAKKVMSTFKLIKFVDP